MDNRWWSLHTHSLYSVNDALSNIPEMVATAANLDYPALGLTDHGNPSGAAQLYSECRKAGIEPLPGMELYVAADAENKAAARKTMHLTMAAYTEKGYRNLCRFSTLANRKFYYKAILDFAFETDGFFSNALQNTLTYAVVAVPASARGEPGRGGELHAV